MPTLFIRDAPRSEAPMVHAVMLAGFEEYRRFAVPSSALTESLAVLIDAMRRGGALLALEGDLAVGAVRYEISPDALSFARLAVRPTARRRGVGRALVAHLEALGRAADRRRVVITVRSQQPDNRPYYTRLGYAVTGYSARYGIANLVTVMEKSLA